MATSLLEPDSSVWNTPLLLKGDDTPDALRPDPQADALGQTYSAITDYMARQQQQSADQGLWDNTTGLPTQKGLLDAIGQTGTAVALGTGSGGDAPAPGFTAYHGSPHAFDQFDLSKIGTGEGAQAYGHGMYLADREGVARSYRDALSQKQSGVMVDGTPAEQSGLSPGAVQMAQMHLDGTSSLDTLRASNEASLAKAQAGLEKYPNSQINQMNADMAQRSLAALDELKGKDLSFNPNPGHMYEVNVNADPAHFLDWDKRMMDQSGHVQDTLRPLMQQDAASKALWMSNPTGEELVRGLPGLEARMSAAGIPGIRYLDQNSRGAGEGTKNSVVFDPATMEIIRRYGLAGLMAGGGAAALGGQSGQQQ